MPALDSLFDQLLERGGSDLHIAAGYRAMARVKGELVPLGDRTLSRDDCGALLYELLDEARAHTFRTTGDLDFAYALGERARFRANFMMKTTGPGAVFRTIPSKIPTAEQLQLPAAVLELVERKSGLVLVTGPTGSGKSTTLAAMLGHVNATRDAHILTIEDPIEFVHQPQRCQITHREVGIDSPSFADAIRSAGRENADIILVGELRGAQTMRLALQTASFGVLVLATVHTNSATSTVDRFVNSFPATQQPQIRGMMSDALAGIVAQQLLRTKDGKGRVAAHEILIRNRGVGSAIREAKTTMLPSLIQAGARDGMQSMDSTLERLVKDGRITAQDALERAANKDHFARLPSIAAGLTPHNGASV